MTVSSQFSLNFLYFGLFWLCIHLKGCSCTIKDVSPGDLICSFFLLVTGTDLTDIQGGCQGALAELTSAFTILLLQVRWPQKP